MRALAILTNTSVKSFDITVVKNESEIPPRLLSTLSYRTVTREFLTEDEVDNPEILNQKVKDFLDDFGMYPADLKIFVVVVAKPETGWGSGFEYRVKILVFPRYVWEIEQKYSDNPDFDYIWAIGRFTRPE